MADIDGTISKQRVKVDSDTVTLYTKEGSRAFDKPVPKYKSAAGGGGSLGDAVDEDTYFGRNFQSRQTRFLGVPSTFL